MQVKTIDEVFSTQEYRERIAAVKRAGQRAAMDALIVTDPKNIFYLTGYDAYSFYVPQALIVAVDQPDEPVLILREQDVPAATALTWLAPANVVGYDEAYIHGTQHPMRVVAETISTLHWRPKNVGIDESDLSVGALHALHDTMPDATLMNATGLVEWIRCHKSAREIDLIREAASFSDQAMLAAIDIIEPGVREADVAADIYHELISGKGSAYGSTPWQPYLSCGVHTNNPHMSWSGRFIAPDSPITIELGGHRHNYAAGLARTVYLGSPPPEYRRLERTVAEGYDIARSTMAPGNTAEQVHAAWSSVLGKQGFTKNARIGYSIGISFPKTAWIENTVSLAAGDRTELRPNMVLHLMLAVWLNDIGYSLSETFVVGETGSESLSSLPHELIVK
ncbi:Xaa-Pro peptidase family protein [Mycobacterium sp. 21AC1]|uniref:M24 family metallopeptidase n=1 Tax=[Mycobacterium] appelbergii TaxID=2939269 RepID=UPI002938F31B|nr:Xaa-Pro peptidase family protein [Mycobacterium sp. 21AC1]MDV3129035.1 Xaa-Pro peptidase family protein [Mycobacterium sp. 21AC1]